jgi:hypothetical protein
VQQLQQVSGEKRNYFWLWWHFDSKTLFSIN